MARRSCVCGICDSVNLPSVCTTCINHRLLERYKVVKNLVQERDVLRRRLDEELIAKREAELQQHWRVEHAERRAELKERLRQCKEGLVQEQTKREQMHHDLGSRARLFAAASAQVAKKRSELLAHFYPDLVRAQSLVHTAVASELYQKRRKIFRSLCKILPLRRSSITVEERQKWEGSLSGQQSVRICGARLPIGDDPLSTPHTDLAASLGYLVQLVGMAARYSGGPLLHSSGFAASSSRIWQRASYFDSKPGSRSEELPLFIPRQHGRFWDEGIELSKSVGSNLGFSSMESPRIETVGSTASLVNYGTSSRTRESYPDVQKGIKLLRRSVGCLCAYGFGHLSLSVPSDMPIFDAFAELLNILASKEPRSRSSRGNQQPNGRFGLSEGRPARTGSGLSSQSGGNWFSPEPLGQRTTSVDRVISWNDPENSYSDSELNVAAPNSSDSTVDDWNLVEHPRLPPPPSHSEDVEHWTRAMFVDATK